jgi:hypothetical protein
MIVQIINNGGDVGPVQFDLMIPGGGVGEFNACSTQWGSSNLGSQYGGFLTSCTSGDATSCVMNYCNTLFAGKPDLMAGCTWFTGWFETANNPSIVFAPVACPSALTQKSGVSDPGP